MDKFITETSFTKYNGLLLAEFDIIAFQLYSKQNN